MTGGVRWVQRLSGTALMVASCNPPAVVGEGGLVVVWVVLLALAAWWAAPMVDARPVRSSMRWREVALRRRTTLLPAAAVVVAAVTGPAVWLAACVAALLLAYLLVSDPWVFGVTAPRSGPARPPVAVPALVSASASAVVLLSAQVPVAGGAWSRLLAALAVAAAVACLTVTLAVSLRAHRSP